jgi:hypothetical protein
MPEDLRSWAMLRPGDRYRVRVPTNHLGTQGPLVVRTIREGRPVQRHAWNGTRHALLVIYPIIDEAGVETNDVGWATSLVKLV